MAEVVVAHESEGIREAICRLCADAGYAVHAVGEGHAALKALERRPAALVLDVALPEVHAYEIVEESKRRAPETRIVLVASIYNRTGYKRRPTSLYGADDYVEQHHIPDALLVKLERLIGPAPRAVELPPPHMMTPEGVEIRDAGEQRIAPVAGGPAKAVSPPLPMMIERAERLARLIVADIALYNGDALDAADHHGHEAELEARLRLDLEEGRLLFDLRVPAEVRRTRDFIAEALAEIRHQRRVAAKAGGGNG
ncbi:MAG TPA: response regulator [Polyangia bacterium]|nr:response regulator [Polyangia bacterium]